MTKVAYNACYGGFSLSSEAVKLAKAKAGPNSKWQEIDSEYGYLHGIERHDDVLVSVIEELGESAGGRFSDLQIKEIGSDKYIIDEYDGIEEVETPETIEWIVIK